MQLANVLPLLFAAESSADHWYQQGWVQLLLLLGVILFSFAIGKFLGKSLRMPDYWWKIALIIGSVGCGIVIVVTAWPPKYGVDLRGGVTLIYEVESLESGEQVNLAAMVQQLKRRANPGGTKEVVIRKYGSNQVEIIVPDLTQDEIDELKKTLETAGSLSFYIVANRDDTDHKFAIEFAEEQKDTARWVYDVIDSETRVPVAMWAKVGRDDQNPQSRKRGVFPFKVDVSRDIIRNAESREWIDVDFSAFSPTENGVEFELWLKEQGIEEIEVLMFTDEEQVKGEDLAVARSDFDQQGRPMIAFEMKKSTAKKMGRLTGANIPDGSLQNRLGIVMDNELLSAPVIQSTITESGQITGRFTKEEVDFLVGILQAGRLPGTLKTPPLSENRIDSELGRDLRDQGLKAIGISLLLVLVFMVIYYRFCGIVACWALLSNLVLIVALVLLVKQPFTLTGLAGLVLTVGMSVDANVLIFERIREELNRGSALRLAIRNGFSCASTTIVDANLTTLLTAIVLYTIGTDQIRGFSVTLILGILMSMFTAIFCARVIFEIAERKRRIAKLSMLRILGTSTIDFIGKRRIAAVVSAVVIIVGIVGLVDRGKGILDIDLGGGSSVEMVLKEPLDADSVREKLAERLGSEEVDGARITFTVQEVDRTNDPRGEHPRQTVYKIDSSIPGGHELQLDEIVQDVFGDALEMRTLNFTEITPADSPTPDDQQTRADLPADNILAAAFRGAPDDVDSATDATSSGAASASDTDQPAPAGDDASGQDPKSASPTSSSADEAADEPASAPDPPEEAPAGKLSPRATTLTFKFPVKASSIRERVHQIARDLNISYLEEGDDDIGLTPKFETGNESHGYTTWDLELKTVSDKHANDVLTGLKSQIDSEPYYPTKSAIGSQVAGDMMMRATAALLASLGLIIIYIWIRFQKVVFGLAAVVALIHDVMVVLGAFAVSAWVAGALGVVGIDEFKISLPVVAAFLTIIGYSLNDTIVVFDRIREVRGKSPELTGEMINTSIGQTLSRTILTSVTTFVVVFILFAWGGNAIHAFAFALVVGVLVGTYSSIFVASPALLWMISRQSRGQGKPAAKPS